MTFRQDLRHRIAWPIFFLLLMSTAIGTVLPRPTGFSFRQDTPNAVAIPIIKASQDISAQKTLATPLAQQFQRATNLRDFYDRISSVEPAFLTGEARYFVAQALEECFNASHRFAEITMACLGFETEPITQREIMSWLLSAAEAGDTRAIARMMLFRDIGEEKLLHFELLKKLLSTEDPFVIRDLGAYLNRGEQSWKFGEFLVVDAQAAAAAWELAACDFGLDCAHLKPEGNNVEVVRLRQQIVTAILRRDWASIGLA
jgi:hypothetical protein